MNGGRGMILVLALTLAPASARADDPLLSEALQVVGLDMSIEALVAHCETTAPGASGGLRARWRSWREAARVPAIETALGPQKLAGVRETLASVAAKGVDKMKTMGPPAQTCPMIPGWLTEGPFDTKTAFPALYAGLDQVTGQANAVASSAPAARAETGGVYYTPAQLKALVSSWFGSTRDISQARRMAQRPIYIQGKVEKARDSYFLVTNDGVFRSRLPVSTGLGERVLGPLEGRTITVAGNFTDIPSGLAFMENTRIVDPTGLKPATISDKPGLYRLDVKEDQVTAAPGAGLKPSAIHGLLYDNETIAGGGLKETVLLLLNDGTYYSGETVSPDRLDVAKSRRLEPQLWGRWRKADKGYQVQPQDDFGAPQDWRAQEGFLTGAWKPGQTLNGAYTAQAFHGSLATGGVHTSTSYLFKPDGRFERIGYAQGGSGSMAAMGGFVGSSSSLSTGKGTTSSAGGGNAGVFAGAQSRSDDGASHRGSYRLNGLTIELAYDDGHRTSTLCAPWGSDGKSIYMFGQTFSRR